MNKIKKSLQWLTIGLITITFTIISRNVAIAQPISHYSDLAYPPLGEVELPKYDRLSLDNGMVIYLMEDHRLPLITGNAVLKTGDKFEPTDKIGLATLTGDLLRTGGTTNRSRNEIDTILEQKAASIETSIGTNSGNVTFNTLSYDLEEVFNLFADILRNPAFEETFLDFEKNNLRGSISRRNDNPGNVVRREFRKLIYGDDSPYARTIEYSTLENITREDIINFYQQHIRPENIILGIVGDFEPDKIKNIIAQTLGDWEVDTPAPAQNIPMPTQVASSGLYLIDQPQLTQSNILLGHLGGELDDPNYPTLTVINGLLNGFGGRLHNQVRSRQGLAYSVYGVWGANYNYPGLFLAGGQTNTDTSGQFIQAINQEIEKLRTERISQEDLDYAKNSILNSFVFQFQSPNQILSRIMTYEYYGYPQDFIFDYQKAVTNTTAQQVFESAQNYLQPDKFVTLVVGNGDEVKDTLAVLNQDIQTLDITIPLPNS
ncbi:insulinase family protein [Cyanobacterium stanieri LEGE 03274]|uniref:Insulinase family protein n=1 Tax=Cyanobacterium stanieri LEGE 03274 TaxID=1828756 RepID=A0ABR9V0K4_9CHRO|nr:pitrilysin family protein [Cyanobacterium stanieri]MBE9221405.1 insulinase family protein [Cyanobacterium stanieri LEGE 03274]